MTPDANEPSRPPPASAGTRLPLSPPGAAGICPATGAAPRLLPARLALLQPPARPGLGSPGRLRAPQGRPGRDPAETRDKAPSCPSRVSPPQQLAVTAPRVPRQPGCLLGCPPPRSAAPVFPGRRLPQERSFPAAAGASGDYKGRSDRWDRVIPERGRSPVPRLLLICS